jgi:uncharacterized protein YegL
MRRLPIYFLVDTKSEIGSESLNVLTNGLSSWVSSLRQNPQAIETVHISINSLSENNYKINELLPLENIGSVQLIHTESCCLGKNLSLLSETLQREKINTQNRKQDWTPLIFVLLLNEPDDDFKKRLGLYKKLRHKTVAVLFDNKIILDNIKCLTGNVVDGNTTDSSLINKFLWESEDIFPFSEKIDFSENIINLKK